MSPFELSTTTISYQSVYNPTQFSFTTQVEGVIETAVCDRVEAESLTFIASSCPKVDDELLKMAGGRSVVSLSLKLCASEISAPSDLGREGGNARADVISAQARVYPNVNEKLGRSWWDYGKLSIQACPPTPVYKWF